jgi:hypothetical protein
MSGTHNAIYVLQIAFIYDDMKQSASYCRYMKLIAQKRLTILFLGKNWMVTVLAISKYDLHFLTKFANLVIVLVPHCLANFELLKISINLKLYLAVQKQAQSNYIMYHLDINSSFHNQGKTVFLLKSSTPSIQRTLLKNS